ncbi:MAG: tetratricopeptide repeat protein [bacterium]|jgi:tetratricopeptide (TPR) repeat protein
MAEVTLEQVPQKIKDLFNRGFVAMERGNLDYAIDMFTSCLALEPRLHKARKFLRAAEIKRFKSQGGGQLTHLISSVTGFSNLIKAQALLKSKPMEALQAAEKLLLKDPLNLSYIKLLDKAAMAAGEPEIAIQTLASTKEHYPHDAELLERLGRLYMETDQPRLARECFETLCELKPQDSAALKLLKDAMAIDSMSKDGWEKVGTKGTKFTDLIRDRKESDSLARESKAVVDKNDTVIMIEENKARIKREPGNMNYRRALANLYRDSKMFTEAVTTLQEAQNVSGGRDPQIDQTISAIQIQMMDEEIAKLTAAGMTAAAEEKQKDRELFMANDLQDRVSRYPNDLQLKYEFGVMLFDQNRINEAIQQFQASQRNAQRRIQSLFYIGRCFRAKQQYDMAIDQLQQAVAELPVMDDTKKAVVYELGSIYEITDRAAEAMECFKQIYQIEIGYLDVAAKVEQGYKSN